MKEEISGCCFQVLSHKYHNVDALLNSWLDRLVNFFFLLYFLFLRLSFDNLRCCARIFIRMQFKDLVKILMREIERVIIKSVTFVDF